VTRAITTRLLRPHGLPHCACGHGSSLVSTPGAPCGGSSQVQPLRVKSVNGGISTTSVQTAPSSLLAHSHPHICMPARHPLPDPRPLPRCHPLPPSTSTPWPYGPSDPHKAPQQALRRKRLSLVDSRGPHAHAHRARGTCGGVASLNPPPRMPLCMSHVSHGLAHVRMLPEETPRAGVLEQLFTQAAALAGVLEQLFTQAAWRRAPPAQPPSPRGPSSRR